VPHGVALAGEAKLISGVWREGRRAPAGGSQAGGRVQALAHGARTVRLLIETWLNSAAQRMDAR